jgi:hypothetical protein
MSKLLRPIALLAVLIAAVAVAGCGGQKVAADEVPGDPVNLTVPEVTKGGSSTLAGGSNSSSSSSSSTSADATPTPTPEGSTNGTSTTNQSSGTQSSGTSGTTQSGTTGGTGTTQQQTQTQTQTQNGNSGTSGNGNSSGKPFDDFCKNNPGAC